MSTYDRHFPRIVSTPNTVAIVMADNGIMIKSYQVIGMELDENSDPVKCITYGEKQFPNYSDVDIFATTGTFTVTSKSAEQTTTWHCLDSFINSIKDQPKIQKWLAYEYTLKTLAAITGLTYDSGKYKWLCKKIWPSPPPPKKRRRR